MKALHIAAFSLLVVGGLNWGFAAFGYNLVNILLGSWPPVETVVYVLVGLSAIVEVATHKQSCKACVSPAAAPM